MRHLLLLSFVLILTSGFSQETKRIKRKRDRETETYYALKSDIKIKHGSYEFKIGAHINEKGEYKFNKKSGVWTTYDYLGNIIEEITYLEGEKTGEAKFYDGDGLLSAQGSFLKGNRKGNWNIYSNNILIQTFNFDDLKMIKCDSLNEHYQPLVLSSPYKGVMLLDSTVSYKGGISNLYTLLSESLKTSSEDINKTFYVQFIVDELGNVSDVSFFKNHPYYKDSFVGVFLSTSGQWIPAKLEGVSVKTKTVIPVRIK